MNATPPQKPSWSLVVFPLLMMAGSIVIALFNPTYDLAIKMGWWFLGLAVIGHLVVIRDLLRK